MSKCAGKTVKEQVPSNTTQGHLDCFYMYIEAMLNKYGSYADHLKLHIILGPDDEHGTSFHTCSCSIFYFTFDANRADSCLCLKASSSYNTSLFTR